MGPLLIVALALLSLLVTVGCWLGWQLLRQNGRILVRLDGLEQQLQELELSAEPVANGEKKSPVRSRLNRNGLKAGTVAPDFRLPRVDGGELLLEEYRGRRVLVIFSDPHCGPCNALAPQLQKFHRRHPALEMVMISRRGVEANYGMFATPIGYLVDESGVTVSDVAVGVEPILALLAKVKKARAEAVPALG